MQSGSTSRKREIGTVGTAVRIILGLATFGSTFYGHFIKGPFRPLPWVIGLLIFPSIFIVWQYLRARRNPARLESTGPLASLINVAVFFALWLTPFYAPAIGFMSDAVLIFYGLSMFLAALRGYGGCEALAISNWLLQRDDQLGCLLYSPIDNAEHKIAERRHALQDADKARKD